MGFFGMDRILSSLAWTVGKVLEFADWTAVLSVVPFTLGFGGQLIKGIVLAYGVIRLAYLIRRRYLIKKKQAV